MKRFREGEGCEMESMNMANVLLLFSSGAGGNHVLTGGAPADHQAAGTRVFECKTCSRRFPSFQALGGHRASHKKPRLGAGGDHDHPAAAAVAGLGQLPPPAAPPAKQRVHECSICGLEFAVGQALGGHMRRHRVAAAEGGVVDGRNKAQAAATPGAVEVAGEKRREVVYCCLGLDLNLPASENDKDFLSLGFGRGLHMVDCSH